MIARSGRAGGPGFIPNDGKGALASGPSESDGRSTERGPDTPAEYQRHSGTSKRNVHRKVCLGGKRR